MTGIKHDYAETELLYNQFTRPSARKALRELKKEVGESPKIMDAGCGPGSHFELFEKIFPNAKIVAVDSSKPHIEEARQKAEKTGIDIDIVKADLEKNLDLEEDSFDMIWFGDVICPSDISNPVGLINNLKPFLNKDGLISIFYGNWLRQMFMPGYARLEQKINAAYEMMHETRNLNNPWQGPDHPEKAIKWLQETGFKEVSQSIHTSNYSPKIPDHVLDYVEHVFKNDYSDAVDEKGREAGLTEEEISKWEKLSDPESLMYLPEKDDYYCSMSCILTYGKV